MGVFVRPILECSTVLLVFYGVLLLGTGPTFYRDSQRGLKQSANKKAPA
jgi:hypothetical protein